MPDHKFRSGQRVQLSPVTSRNAFGGVYVVTKQLPESMSIGSRVSTNRTNVSYGKAS
jgi:hypothetical protein